MTDVVTFGETMVSLRSDAPLTLPGPLTARMAGAESNVAIGLARLGHGVAWASRVGDDTYGRLMVSVVRGEGVDTHVTIDPTRPTGLMVAAARTPDVTSVTYYRAGSAASAIAVDDVTGLVASRPRVIHVTGITAALSASAREAVEHAVRHAGDALVSLDVNHRARLWPAEEAGAVLRPLLDHVDLVIGSPEELVLLGGRTDLIARGIEVVEKRGSDGAAAFRGDEQVVMPALRVTAVDPVGAGDAFTAGYLSALLDGEDLRGRLDRGVVLGAFAVSAKGDYEGLPYRSELGLLGHSSGTTLR